MLVDRRMGVDDRTEFAHRQRVRHRYADLVDDLDRIHADDRRAENAIRLGVGDDLCEAVWLTFTKRFAGADEARLTRLRFARRNEGGVLAET